MRARYLITGVGVSAILLLGGAMPQAALGRPAGELSGAVTGWSRKDLRPVSQPAAIGNRIILYISQGGGLWVIGLSARSGATVWKAKASPSIIAPGVSPGLAITGGRVFYLKRVRTPPEAAEVAALDPHSGREIWHSGLGVFSSWPSVCSDDPGAVCVSGSLASQQKPAGTILKFDARTGQVLAVVTVSTDPGPRELGPDLFDPGHRKPELLVATSGSKVAWRKPLRTIFTLPGASTDWGWNFDRIARAGVFIGSPGWPPIRRTRTVFVSDASRSMTAGFRIRDGSATWRDRGSSYVCHYMPCAGASQAGYSSPGRGETNLSVGLRLRSTGTVKFSVNGGRPIASPDARSRLEGFNPATGRTLWSFDAGHDAGLVTQSRLPPQVGAHTIVLRDKTGRPVIVNLEQGSRRRIASSAAAWCRTIVFYKQNVPYVTGSTPPITEYVGQFALFPCSAARRRLERPARVPGFVGAIGARAGALVVWSDVSAVLAAPSR